MRKQSSLWEQNGPATLYCHNWVLQWKSNLGIWKYHDQDRVIIHQRAQQDGPCTVTAHSVRICYSPPVPEGQYWPHQQLSAGLLPHHLFSTNKANTQTTFVSTYFPKGKTLKQSTKNDSGVPLIAPLLWCQ